MVKAKTSVLKLRRASDLNRIIFGYCTAGLLIGFLQIVLTN